MPRVRRLGYRRDQAERGFSQARGRGAVLTEAPGLVGNPTTIPGCSPTPLTSSVPWVETWWGFALQCAEGVQGTPVMRTVVTCALPPLGVECAAPVGEPGVAVPPDPAASAVSGQRSRASAIANSAPAGAHDSLCRASRRDHETLRVVGRAPWTAGSAADRLGASNRSYRLCRSKRLAATEVAPRGCSSAPAKAAGVRCRPQRAAGQARGAARGG